MTTFRQVGMACSLPVELVLTILRHLIKDELNISLDCVFSGLDSIICVSGCMRREASVMLL